MYLPLDVLACAHWLSSWNPTTRELFRFSLSMKIVVRMKLDGIAIFTKSRRACAETCSRAFVSDHIDLLCQSIVSKVASNATVICHSSGHSMRRKRPAATNAQSIILGTRGRIWSQRLDLGGVCWELNMAPSHPIFDNVGIWSMRRSKPFPAQVQVSTS